VTGKPIGDLYRERIIEPLGLQGTSFPDLADSSLPEPHAQGYTLQSQSPGGEPINVTDWSSSEAWTAGAMISTVEDLLAYGRVLGSAGEGLLPPEQQAERLDSFVSDLPPLNQPPLNGDLAYGLGLANDHGWIGHNGEIPGYNTYLLYHPDLDATVGGGGQQRYLLWRLPRGQAYHDGWTTGHPLRRPRRPGLQSTRRGAKPAPASRPQ
jgi:D-alanyl-D-alanine carboxypeptidase